MRCAILTVLLLASCSEVADPRESLVGVYRGQGRDALCVARSGEGLRAGLITYGDGNANCSFIGPAQASGEALILTPRGDSECSVELRIASGVVSLGRSTPACAFYCGPGADYSGRELLKQPDSAIKVTDFADDPLC